MSVSGRALISAMFAGTNGERPPFVPVLGAVVPVIAQVDPGAYIRDGRVHSRALAELGRAMSADALTVGFGTDLEAGLDAVGRLRSTCPDLALVGCPGDLTPATIRPWCETGVEVLIVKASIDDQPRLKMAGRIAAFYGIPVLVMTGEDEGAEVAERCGLAGAIVADPKAGMPGVVGGGITWDLKTGDAPRGEGFFWSFKGEVPPETHPEALVALGRELTDGNAS